MPQGHHDGERWCVWLVKAEGEGEMKKLLLSVAIAGLMVGSAHANNQWKMFANNGDDEHLFIDESSVDVIKGKTYATIMDSFVD
jgi:hypothetical protein